MGMSPSVTQIINFFTIIMGSVLSIVMTPNLCSSFGDAGAVIIIDFISAIFYSLFLVVY